MGAPYVLFMLLAVVACGVHAGRKVSASQLTCYKMESYTFRESYVKVVQKKKKDCWPPWLVDCDHDGPKIRTIYKTSFRKVRSMKRAETPILQRDLSDRYQVIESPRYPYAYFRNLECEWNFVLPRNHLASIKFNSFNIESSDNCTNDRLSITSGSKARTVCGYRQRVQLKKMKNRRVKIVFRTDSSNAGSEKAPLTANIGFTGFLLATERSQKHGSIGGATNVGQGGRNYSGNGQKNISCDSPEHDDLIDMLTGKSNTCDLQVQEVISQSVQIDWSIVQQRLNAVESTQATEAYSRSTDK